jgi:hypothetical protein
MKTCLRVILWRSRSDSDLRCYCEYREFNTALQGNGATRHQERLSTRMLYDYDYSINMAAAQEVVGDAPMILYYFDLIDGISILYLSSFLLLSFIF